MKRYAVTLLGGDRYETVTVEADDTKAAQHRAIEEMLLSDDSCVWKPHPPTDISSIQALTRELLNCLDDDIYTDAEEYQSRVTRVWQLKILLGEELDLADEK